MSSHHKENAQGKHKKVRCPLCGEKYGNLPMHLARCADEQTETANTGE